MYGSIDETVGIGINVHMLQPGFGWVPLWKSNIYPFEEHTTWYKQRYGLEPSCFGDYMLQDGDLSDFLQRCRKKGMTAYISMHHKKIDFTFFTGCGNKRNGR